MAVAVGVAEAVAYYCCYGCCCCCSCCGWCQVPHNEQPFTHVNDFRNRPLFSPSLSVAYCVLCHRTHDTPFLFLFCWARRAFLSLPLLRRIPRASLSAACTSSSDQPPAPCLVAHVDPNIQFFLLMTSSPALLPGVGVFVTRYPTLFPCPLTGNPSASNPDLG